MKKYLLMKNNLQLIQRNQPIGMELHLLHHQKTIIKKLNKGKNIISF